MSEQTDEGWSVKELWEKYEDIAKHFNDLLIKLRTQALGAVAAISTLVGIFSGTGTDNKMRWELAAAVFCFLCLFWIAVWIIDFCYYNRLLVGAVDAILDLEKLSVGKLRVGYIDISTKIERAVAGESPSFDKDKPDKFTKCFGRWAFYVIVFAALVLGLCFSCIECTKTQTNRSDTTCGRTCGHQLSKPLGCTETDTSVSKDMKGKSAESP